MKQTFAAKTYAAKTFASGTWVGFGEETEDVEIPGVEYRLHPTRPQYKVPDVRPHYISRGTD